MEFLLSNFSWAHFEWNLYNHDFVLHVLDYNLLFIVGGNVPPPAQYPGSKCLFLGLVFFLHYSALPVSHILLVHATY